jgi:WD40 repeat protein
VRGGLQGNKSAQPVISHPTTERSYGWTVFVGTHISSLGPVDTRHVHLIACSLTIAVSPDGQRIVSGSADKNLQMWDAKSGQPIGEPLKGHTDWVASVAFSPDGRRIVSASNDGTVRQWNTEDGRQIGAELQGHRDAVEAAAFSPDGRYIVSAATTANCVSGTPTLGSRVVRSKLTRESRSMGSRSAGGRLVSGGGDNKVRLWDTATRQPIGEPLTTDPPHRYRVRRRIQPGWAPRRLHGP